MPHDDIPNMFGRGFKVDSDSSFISLRASYNLVIFLRIISAYIGLAV